MANLEKMTAQYVDEGYSELLAEARVCQDIVLKASVAFERILDCLNNLF